MDHCLLINKKPFIHIRDEGCLRHDDVVRPGLRGTTPNYMASCVSTHTRLSFAITGNPADDYSAASLRSPSKSLVRETGEFGLVRSRWALCWALTSLSQLADGMTYYSCHDFSQTRQVSLFPSFRRPFAKTCQVFYFGGPRGIRTPDLLNAIETRSQLRYGPGFTVTSFVQ